MTKLRRWVLPERPLHKNSRTLQIWGPRISPREQVSKFRLVLSECCNILSKMLSVFGQWLRQERTYKVIQGLALYTLDGAFTGQITVHIKQTGRPVVCGIVAGDNDTVVGALGSQIDMTFWVCAKLEIGGHRDWLVRRRQRCTRTYF